MNSPLDNLLSRYELKSVDQSTNALREIAQEIILLGLWRGKFFEHACFYGGTALRIIYGLDRFSLDMDFSLNKPDADFTLKPYLGFLEKELHAFGFDITIQGKQTSGRTKIESAFLKMNTRINMLMIGVPASIVSRVAREQLLKIKMEVDTDPPGSAGSEVSFLYRPQAFSIRTYDLPSMFAGKLHAAIARAWQTRVKGRDWYDLVWFVSRETPASLSHLRARLIQTGHISANALWDDSHARAMLLEKINRLDIQAARSDVLPFLKDPSAVNVWSREFFRDLVGRIRFL
ncbi:MAG: nucleotidyl transferase AbiEii/AbiGii toxin family protein [Chitinivibrionales bacterium]|nr:nucleotidyl transferase AbiEii/AbiGii toxin family protein [Chitinivibrionales bacterium]